MKERERNVQDGTSLLLATACGGRATDPPFPFLLGLNAVVEPPPPPSPLLLCLPSFSLSLSFSLGGAFSLLPALKLVGARADLAAATGGAGFDLAASAMSLRWSSWRGSASVVVVVEGGGTVEGEIMRGLRAELFGIGPRGRDLASVSLRGEGEREMYRSNSEIGLSGANTCFTSFSTALTSLLAAVAAAVVVVVGTLLGNLVAPAPVVSLSLSSWTTPSSSTGRNTVFCTANEEEEEEEGAASTATATAPSSPPPTPTPIPHPFITLLKFLLLALTLKSL